MRARGRRLHKRRVFLRHITHSYNFACGGVAAIEAKAAGAKKNFPLLRRVANKSRLLSGGLPEAQRIVSACRQAGYDLVERSLVKRISISLDEVSTGRGL